MKRKSQRILSLGLMALSAIFPQTAKAEEIGASESKNLSLTIYNQNFGIVRDVREIELKNGLNFLRVGDVAAKIEPVTVSIVSLTAPNAVVVREQNYQYDLIDPDTILGKCIGKEVKFRLYLDNGQVHEVAGTLLNAPNSTIGDPNGSNRTSWHGLVIKTASGIILRPQGEAEVASLPPGLISKPSLLWKLESTKAGTHKTEISYRTNGISWLCDYVAIVSADDKNLDLTSWVTLDNKSGAAYKNAALKLLAGDVHRVQSQPRVRAMAGMTYAKAAAPEPQFAEKSFAEYHLYTLKDRTDVNDNETKQLSLFNANDISVKKIYTFEPGNNFYGSSDRTGKVQVKVEFDNSEQNHVGMPMPKGTIRVYKRDDDGSLEFIGEDQIDHTPRNEKVKIYVGDAFDIVGERIQKTNERPVANLQRQSWETSIRNHKDTKVTVKIVEHQYGDWSITSCSSEYTKKDATTFEIPVEVPANGEVKVTYTVETRY